MDNFWQKLNSPFTALAPLDGVTDVVFRQVVVSLGKPDVLFTEFTNCEALLSAGKEKALIRLRFDKNEQPIVAQIWGTNPESFYQVARLVKEMGFVGIDINMGCPDRKITKNGACSGLLKNPQLAAEIIKATKKGAGDLPVSVKTRIGSKVIDIKEWIGFLLKQNLAVLTVHLRTVAELSKVDAHWELMPEIIKLRNEIAPQTLIIGNGDLNSLEEIKEKYKQYGCDGFMVGRGIFNNPWFFNKKIDIEKITPENRVKQFLAHVKLFKKTFGDTQNFALLKKFCKTYINNFPEASSLREKVMSTKKLEELIKVLKSY